MDIGQEAINTAMKLFEGKEPLIGPFLGICLMKVLEKIQHTRPEVGEDFLRLFWKMFDSGMVEPTILCDSCYKRRGKVGKNKALLAVASYLVMTEYFETKGDFSSAIKRQMGGFKLFGITDTDTISTAVQTLSEVLLQHFTKTVDAKRTR